MSAEEDEGSLRGPDKSCSSDVDVPSKRPKVQDNSPDIEAGDSSEPSLELPPKEKHDNTITIEGSEKDKEVNTGSQSEESRDGNDTSESSGTEDEDTEEAPKTPKTAGPNKIDAELSNSHSQSLATPSTRPKAIFGSAAKNIMSFTSVSSSQRADFTMGPGLGVEAEAKSVLFPKIEASQSTTTGEEEERAVFTGRARLFEFESSSREWKEKGIGVVKVNENQVTGASRLLMRSDGVLKVLVNSRLFPGINYSLLNERAVRVVLLKDQQPMQCLFRFKNPLEAQEFLIEVSSRCDDI